MAMRKPVPTNTRHDRAMLTTTNIHSMCSVCFAATTHAVYSSTVVVVVVVVAVASYWKYIKLLQNAGGQRLHRCCPMANNVENIDHAKSSWAILTCDQKPT